MGLLRRLGVGLDRRELVVLAVELGRRLGPQLFHDEDRLTRLGPAMLEVATHDGGLFTVPTGADTEQESLAKTISPRDLFSGGRFFFGIGAGCHCEETEKEPPAAEQIEGGDRLGERQGVVLGYQ